MQNKLQAAGEVLGQVLDPSNLAQVTIVAGMIALGWSLSRLLQQRFASDSVPRNWHERAAEATWVISPYAVTLLLLATADRLMHALRIGTHLIDLAVQLTGLLLLVRLAVYLLRVSLG